MGGSLQSKIGHPEVDDRFGYIIVYYSIFLCFIVYYDSILLQYFRVKKFQAAQDDGSSSFS